jgi:hypothetical protein
MIRTLLFCLLLSSTVSEARSCFHEHVADSIRVNSERRTIYLEEDKEASRVFGVLRAAERLTLPIAAHFDRKAKVYHERDVDIFCREFLPMRDLGTSVVRDYPKENFRSFDWRAAKRKIAAALERGDSKEVQRLSLNAVRVLLTTPSYLCLTRHFFESIYRFSYFLPIRQSEARAKGLADPTDLFTDAIKLQLVGLWGAYQIDRQARPVQERGYPVLCQELPDLLHDLPL